MHAPPDDLCGQYRALPGISPTRQFIATGAFRGERKLRPRAGKFKPEPVQESALDAPSMAD
jgi:hypothetical protein